MTLAFALHTYHDEAAAQEVAGRLREFYPESRLLLIDDARDRLKLQQYGGRWTLRYLTRFLDGPGDVVVKVDPDTAVLRAATSFPDADIFGVITSRGEVMGGAFGMSRDCAKRIVASGLLMDSKYTWDRYGHLYRTKYLGESISMQDRIMADIVKRLDLKCEPWAEAFVTPGPEPAQPDGDYAFVHPRKIG